ncbi:elongation factor P [Anaerolineales bacterium]
MIDVNQLRKGTTFLADDKLYRVVNYSHSKPGRGKATIRVTVRDLRTGSTTELTYSSGQTVEDVRVEAQVVQYLYNDGEFAIFMDNATFEQPQLRLDVFGDDATWLKEGFEMKLLSFRGEIIDFELPKSAEYEVIDVEFAVAGDRANNPTKKIVLETGREVSAPMFINVGDVVKVNIENAEYVTRVNS